MTNGLHKPIVLTAGFAGLIDALPFNPGDELSQ